MANAQHSAKSGDHGTPVEVVSAGRIVLGGFDLDPASSESHNDKIRATEFYTAEDSGLVHTWAGRLFVNAPGTCELLVCGNKKVCSCQLVRKFWNKLIDSYLHGKVKSAIWIGFSLEQLASLQNNTTHCPLDFPLCYPRKRMKFRGDNPTHANYIALLPDKLNRSTQEDMFHLHFSQFGQVVL